MMETKISFISLPIEILLRIIEIEPVLAVVNREMFRLGRIVRYESIIGPGRMTMNSISSKQPTFSQYAKFVRFINEFTTLDYAVNVKNLSMHFQTATNNAKELYLQLDENLKKFNLESLIINQPPNDDLWNYIPIKRGIKSVTIYSKDVLLPVHDLIYRMIEKSMSIRHIQLHFLQDDIDKFKRLDGMVLKDESFSNLETVALRAILVSHKQSNKKHPAMRHQLKPIKENDIKFHNHLDSTRVFRRRKQLLEEVTADKEKTDLLAKIYNLDNNFDTVAEYFDNFKVID